MSKKTFYVFILSLSFSLVFGDGAATTIPENTTDAIPLDAFPLDFTWGVATSSYQIEGAWNKSGKGESIWDHMVHHQPYKIRNCDNGDESADSYKFVSFL